MKHLKISELSKVGNTPSEKLSKATERHRILFSSICSILALCGVVLVAPMSISYAAHSRTIVLRAIQQAMPIAISGEPYIFNLANSVAGGTRPYRCTPRNLGVGTLTLTRACVITGIAPKVRFQQVAGITTIRVTDSARHPNTLELTNVTITTKAAPITPQSFDGSYTFTQITTATITCPPVPGVPSSTTTTRTDEWDVSVLNGRFADTLISMTNSDLGLGIVTLPPISVGGITVASLSYKFSFDPTSGNGVTVTGLGTNRGPIPGTDCTLFQSHSILGKRTSLVP